MQIVFITPVLDYYNYSVIIHKCIHSYKCVYNFRFLQHRNRLVKLGIKADTIMPEWCYNHDGECALEYF